jgi:hypothetical protein
VAQLPTDVPFDAWLDYLFGAPVGPSGFRESEEWWDEQAAPTRTVEHLTRLFEAPAVLLERYPQEQIDRGLWFLAGESGHLGPLLAPGVAWEARRRGLLAIEHLYGRLFAVACTRHLGHLDGGPEPPAPLNSSCYMWWDLFPTWGGDAAHERESSWGASRRARRKLARETDGRPEEPGSDEMLHTVDEAILAVLERTLRIDSEACREGALHGLGHWSRRHPERTAAIVDAWLGTAPAISPELERYAASARAGCVL